MIQPKSRTMLLLLVAFLLGGAAGLALDRTFLNRPSQRKFGRSDVTKEFTERLKLSQSQSASVDSILEAHKGRFDHVRKNYSDAIKLQRDTLRREIRKLLSAEQNSWYDQYIKEMDERETRYRKENR